jgi:toxin ParE1/3/4
MRQLVRTDLAEQDLAQILEYLDERSPVAADRLAAELDDACRLLAAQPGLGRPRDELAPGIRSVVIEKKYVVLFRVTDDAIVVVRIVHGAMNLNALDLGDE